MLKKASLILFVLVVVVGILAVILGVWVGKFVVQRDLSPYSAVYLTTGDVYFGKLSWFPRPYLRGVWYLERVPGVDGQAQITILPLVRAFWGPEDKLSLNLKEIVFWSRLRKDSELVTRLASPQLIERPQEGLSLPGAQGQ